MKKRILCAILTLIMLVSLIPAGAISASAASLKISEPAITVLKKMTAYKYFGTCYKVSDTQQYRIGYGTVCEKSHAPYKNEGKDHAAGAIPIHTMTEKEADTALREYLATLDKKVNSFASNNGMSFKQNQHDALVIFSYGVGTAWMSGNGVVKTAIVNGGNSNELLSAMYSIGNDMTRRKIEVNMYVNGVYSNVVPDTFKQVTYDANGGSMAQGSPYTMQFDTTQTTDHIPTPVRNGYKFLGWYTHNDASIPNKRYPELNASCANKDLFAVWQKSDLKDDTANLWDKTPKVDYTYKISQLPSLKAYNAPNGKENESGTKWLKAQASSTKVDIFTEYMDAKGNRWGNIYGQGWVILSGSAGDSSDNVAEIDVTVTVTNSYLKSRKNATIFSSVNGSYSKGDKLRIINTASHDGFLWGQVAKSADDNTPIGWVALMYTNWNSVKDNGNTGSSSNTKTIARATVTTNGYLNMRSSAGTDGKIVGAVAHNETVNIYEIKTVNGHKWGRTNGGWICLTYCDVSMLDGNKIENISDEGALSYVFSADLTEDCVPLVSPSMNANPVQETYEFKDDDKKVHTVKLWPEEDEDINVHNMVIRDNQTWAKISWRVDLDDNGENDTTKYGWLPVNTNENETEGYGTNVSLSISSHPVQMNPVKYTVVADEVTVRKNPGSGAAALSIKLNKGVEIQVNAIKLVGENIWGYLDNEHVARVGEGNNSIDGAFDGWINLSSKYVKRSNLPDLGGDDNKELSPTGKTATIVNTDSVNVRITGSTYGKLIGKLTRGTTANILEVSANGKWYNLDIDVDKNPATGSWVSAQYVEVNDGYVGDKKPDGTPAPVTTGIGVVANTYAGVNVRTGAGQSYPSVGKLLPGTTVKISEIKQGGAAKWAHVEQGWVCMDYITMLKEETSYPEGTTDPSKGTSVGSYDELEKTKTTAVYTGTVNDKVRIYSETIHWPEVSHHANVAAAIATSTDVASEQFVRWTNPGENVTIYELIKVTEKVMSTDVPGGDHGTQKEEIITSYWARTNDGYIYYPQQYIKLDALDEKVHTLPGEKLNIRETPVDGAVKGKLKQGDQVKVTALEIRQDKVWGFIEHDGVEGWIRLDLMSEGAFYVEEKPSEPQTPPTNDPIIGAGGDNGGFVGNGSGYRYTGKVIRDSKVNVRATPSTSAKITTTMKNGQSLVVYETTVAENMAWGRCDAGWIYLYYVDLTPCVQGAIDSRVVANNVPGIIYSDSNCSDTVGTYSGMSVIDIYEVVGKMARTNLGWVSTDDLL